MTEAFPVAWVDVFATGPLTGNPLAVVVADHEPSTERMQAFARWTNLSETTFLLPPTDPAADYRVRIFTPARELPFAGHPTLGSCHVWRARHGDNPPEHMVQQCGIGLVAVRGAGGLLSFAAPPRVRTGPLDDATLTTAMRGLGLREDEVLGHAWVDNGAGFCAVRVASVERVLAIVPDLVALAELNTGVVGMNDDPEAFAYEVRSFVPAVGVGEDPVTGALNAGVAQWMRESGLVPERWRVRQGTALGRRGELVMEDDGTDIWVGGRCVTHVSGSATL